MLGLQLDLPTRLFKIDTCARRLDLRAIVRFWKTGEYEWAIRSPTHPLPAAPA